jgi:Protein of unknown function (DUF3431)
MAEKLYYESKKYHLTLCFFLLYSIAGTPDKLIHTSFSRKDLSVPKNNAVTTSDSADASSSHVVQAQAGSALTRPPPPQPPVSILAVLTHYHEDLSWLTDPNTGIMNNSTGTPEFILPIEIYQASDIDSEGFPTFPGLLPPAPANIMAGNFTDKEILAMNYSASGPLEFLPTWPEWAWKFVVEKNATKDKNTPGSVEEAEYLARERLGLPLDGIGPSDYQGWRDYENLFDEEYKRKREKLGRLAGSDNEEEEKNSSFASEDDPLLEEFGIDSTVYKSNQQKIQYLERIKEASRVFTAKNRSEIVTVPDVSPVLPLNIMPNRGSESMAYLTAIIDHYENLPDLMIFMHGHRIAWHTPLLGQDWILRRLVTHPPLDLNLTSTNGYHALGCLERWGNDISQLFPTDIDANWKSNNGPRWHESLAARFAQAWREHLGEAYNMPLPDYVRTPTAATFIATRQAIRRRSKEFYIGMRNWMLETHIENKWLGIVMEFQVGLMIANKPHFSVSQEQCLCELYTICTLPAEL